MSGAAEAMVARIERWIKENPGVSPRSPEGEAAMREICVEFGIDPDRPLITEQEARKAGRNDPCPCGSGVKFKRCHGR